MSCELCKKNIKRNNNIIYCEDCANPLSFKLITKTDAMNNYSLTSSDLKKATYGNAEGYQNSHLYLIDDIEDIAIKKYGSRKNALEVIDNKKKRKESVYKNKHKAKLIRKSELDKYFIGSDIDIDIINCDIYYEYIQKGTIDNKIISVNDAGDIILKKNFYNNYTNYRKIITKKRRKMNSFENYEDIQERSEYLALLDYVKDNYLDHRKMVNELPPKLKDRAFGLSKLIYEHKGKEVSHILDESVSSSDSDYII